MRHLDLFTGILGFSYAAEQVWKDEYELVACCEIDKFCQKVIRKHRPNVEIVEDVRSERIKQFRDIDLLTAGVPCQPASVAGKKRGTSDERWLWPETLDIIGAVRPRWALLENVPGLFSLDEGLAFNGILSGLAEIGYDCWWETIPACAVGAPHRRDRIWIVAYSINNGHCKEKREIVSETAEVAKEDETQHSPTWQPNGTSLVGQDNGFEKIKDVADTTSIRWQPSSCNKPRYRSELSSDRGIINREPTPLTNRAENQWTVEPNVGRVADGVPDRVHRLKSLGNAIVPQVAMVIMQAIKKIGLKGQR